MVRKLAILIVPLALGACVAEPRYPITPPPVETGSRPPAPAASPSAPPPSSPEAPTYYRPQPITGAPPPPDEAVGGLRGRLSAGPARAARSAGRPAPETPREATVRPGESLFELAERMRTPVRAIIDLNGLQPPYDVEPGEVLRIPPPVIYTVKAGDTLMSISRRFSIDPRSLANLNAITMQAPLKPGQRLALPALVKDGQASMRTPGETEAHPAVAPAPARPGPAQMSGAAAGATPNAPPPEPEPPSAETVAAAGKGRFIWPVKGDILSSFGPKGPGQRNDGVNIAAEAGEPVRAAAAGQVVYAGSTIPGFGNLVVVKHADGWTSLYGNLGKIDVRIRAEVAQGQALGVAGLSGAVDRPQVHFELRYAAAPQGRARPVDPQTLLP